MKALVLKYTSSDFPSSASTFTPRKQIQDIVLKMAMVHWGTTLLRFHQVLFAKKTEKETTCSYWHCMRSKMSKFFIKAYICSPTIFYCSVLCWKGHGCICLSHHLRTFYNAWLTLSWTHNPPVPDWTYASIDELPLFFQSFKNDVTIVETLSICQISVE